jgi:hypothetical protein
LKRWVDGNTPASQTLVETLLRIKRRERNIIQIPSITKKIKVRAVARFRISDDVPDATDCTSRTGVSATSVTLIAQWLGASQKTLISLEPKSVTAPVAMGISEKVRLGRPWDGHRHPVPRIPWEGGSARVGWESEAYPADTAAHSVGILPPYAGL